MSYQSSEQWEKISQVCQIKGLRECQEEAEALFLESRQLFDLLLGIANRSRKLALWLQDTEPLGLNTDEEVT